MRRAHGAQPPIEHPDGPERIPMVASSVCVRIEPPPQFGSIETAGESRPRTQHLVSEHRRVRTGEPFTNRGGEPTFGQLPQCAGEPPPREVAQEHLALTPPLLLRRRNPERELDDPAIEERATDFEA